jgi:hypothetical protein
VSIPPPGLKLVISADDRAAVTELNGVAVAEQRIGESAEQAAERQRSLNDALLGAGAGLLEIGRQSMVRRRAGPGCTVVEAEE